MAPHNILGSQIYSMMAKLDKVCYDPPPIFWCLGLSIHTCLPSLICAMADTCEDLLPIAVAEGRRAGRPSSWDWHGWELALESVVRLCDKLDSPDDASVCMGLGAGLCCAVPLVEFDSSPHCAHISAAGMLSQPPVCSHFRPRMQRLFGFLQRDYIIKDLWLGSFVCLFLRHGEASAPHVQRTSLQLNEVCVHACLWLWLRGLDSLNMRGPSVQLLDLWMEKGVGPTKISNMMRPFMGYGMYLVAGAFIAKTGRSILSALR